MILYRPQRGGLREAMDELKQFESIKELLDYVCKNANEFMGNRFTIEPDDLLCELYCEEPDKRIGWNKSYIITFKSFNEVKNKESYLHWMCGEKYNHPCGVFGFFTDDFEENWKEIYNNFFDKHFST